MTLLQVCTHVIIMLYIMKSYGKILEELLYIFISITNELYCEYYEDRHD